MSQRRSSSRSGQALVMVTVALFAMSGLIGMAVDFGWSYFLRRAEQAAADAASTGAANAAMDAINNGTVTMTTLAGHATAASCSTGFTDTRQSACLYAQQNGFSAGGDGGRQDVTVAADGAATVDGTVVPPTAPGVNVHYWVTVRITETVPQLFSAMLGNSTATVAARATAAIADTLVSGSIIALDRGAGEGGPHGAIGLNLDTGSRIFPAPGGILLASTLSPGAGTCAGCTGVSTPRTFIRSGTTAGSLNITGGGHWINGYQNQPDGPMFDDPMRDLGQPPLAATVPTAIGVPNGNLNAICSTASPCGSGIYYATDSNGNATGEQLTVTSSLNFSGGSFGNFVFFGGLNITGGTVNMGPGRYVMAGVLPNNNYQDLSISGSNTNIVGGTGNQSTGVGNDIGRLLILTDTSYPGLQPYVDAVNAQSATPMPSLYFGPSNINPNTLTAYGLNPTMSGLPTDTNSQGYQLSDFGSLLIWQDQSFSSVQYTANGNINTSCAGASIDSPCTQTLQCPTCTAAVSPSLQVGSSQTQGLNGVIYQPRGAYLQLLPLKTLTALQIISGAVDLQSSSTLTLLSMQNPTKMRVVALID